MSVLWDIANKKEQFFFACCGLGVVTIFQPLLVNAVTDWARLSDPGNFTPPEALALFCLGVNIYLHFTWSKQVTRLVLYFHSALALIPGIIFLGGHFLAREKDPLWLLAGAQMLIFAALAFYLGFYAPKPDYSEQDMVKTAVAEVLADKHRRILNSAEFTGKIVLAQLGNPVYQQCRTKCFAYNDCGYPYAFYFPVDARDVSAIVKALLPHKEIEVAVAGGRQSNVSCPNNAVVIDLEKINFVTVEVKNKIVNCGGGCKVKEIDAALIPLGYGFVTGTNGETGVAGLTLSGGWGFLSRSKGAAVDNLLEVEVVLPNGDIVIARDDNEHCKLMKALRGGGGNFGIVTRFQFRIHEIGPCVHEQTVRVVPTLGSTKRVLQNYCRMASEAPEEFTCLAALPCGLPLVLTTNVGVGKVDLANDEFFKKYQSQVTGQWLTFTTTKPETIPYSKVQTLLDKIHFRKFIFPNRIYIKELTDGIIDVLFKYSQVTYPNMRCFVGLFALGGALKTPKLPSTCSLLRTAKFVLHIEATYAVDAAQAEIDKTRRWVINFKKELARVDPDIAQMTFDYTEGKYTTETKEFLRAAKKLYDPTNFFHYNGNILPVDPETE